MPRAHKNNLRNCVGLVVITQDPSDRIPSLSVLTHLTLAQLKRQMGFFTWCAKEHLAQSIDCILGGLASCKIPNAGKVHGHKAYTKRAENSSARKDAETAPDRADTEPGNRTH